MSSIVGAITGGGGGSSWKAQSANLLNPATVAQADQQYANVNTGLDQQQSFLNAIQAQNGLGNQSSVYNQMQGVADGTGPNPAQAMLANSTGQNVANQAALMAGQRGSSANAGMIARQAANTGANIQQNAAGQAAALQSQQSLGALNQMGGIANQQAAQQSSATNAYANTALGAQQNILGAINSQNQAAIGNADTQNKANAAIQGQVAQQQGNMLGGLTGALGSAAQMVPGLLKSAAPIVGGMFGGPAGAAAGSALTAGMGQQAAVGGASELGPNMMMAAEGGQVQAKGPRSMIGQHFHMMANGGKVPALVSPGEKYLNPQAVQQVAQGANPMSVGETIPGKPKVGGAVNSYANDTVSKTLDEGGIVLPRDVTQSKDPAQAAHAFVSAIMKKQAMGGKK